MNATRLSPAAWEPTKPPENMLAIRALMLSGAIGDPSGSVAALVEKGKAAPVL